MFHGRILNKKFSQLYIQRKSAVSPQLQHANKYEKQNGTCQQISDVQNIEILVAPKIEQNYLNLRQNELFKDTITEFDILKNKCISDFFNLEKCLVIQIRDKKE